MTGIEKAAYLKGLVKGLGIEEESKEGKLWGALCELVSDMAHELEDLRKSQLDVEDVLDYVEESLDRLEGEVFDDDEYDYDDDDDITDIGRGYDEDDEELDYDGVMYDVTCPVCGEEISFDEETLSGGSILCPQCGEELEFDLGEDKEGDDPDEDS